MNTSLEPTTTNDNYGMSCSRPNDPIDCALDFQFVKNLPPEEVHTRALSARKLLGKAEKTLVSWLVEIQDRKLYQNFACSSIYHYASRYLKLAEHTVAEFLRSGRKLAELPLLASAYEQGELSSTHIREITRVATPDTEGFWYEAAKNCTTRKIEKLVAFTPKGGLPPGDRKEQAVLPLHGGPTEKQNFCDRAFPEQETAIDNPMTPFCHVKADTTDTRDPLQCRPTPLSARAQDQGIEAMVKYHDKLVVELTGEEMAIMKDAFEKARRESGKKDRRSLLVHMARVFLEGSSYKETGRTSAKPPYQVIFHHHLPSGISWCTTEKGERPVTPQALEKALCDAEIKDADEIHPNGPPSNRRGEDPLRDVNHSRELSQAQIQPSDTGTKRVESMEEGMEYVNELYGKMKRANPAGSPGNKRPRRRARKTIPALVRKRVLDRDGHCCQAPGCSSKLFTVIHHLDPVALGGTDDEHRLITLCRACHDLLHQGTLSVKGQAPDNLVWGERIRL